ncbi:MAG: hypothetical protein ACK2UK_20745, partial [Candidatus Promineifilaceae bacterium]
VIDERLDNEPRRRFHEIIGSVSGPGGETAAGGEATAEGFWMNDHARFSLGESTADAIALWIVLGYTDHPKPVFWHMANATDYEKIAGTMQQVLDEISTCLPFHAGRARPPKD